ncbi:MAG: hypothetical protein ACXWIJ_14740 [Burkholderiales bacterium]
MVALITRFASLAVVAMLVAGCASTNIVDSWSDPSYQGGPFNRIMVLGVTKNTVARRTFEDIFASKLRATGIQAVPAYQYLPQDGPVDEPELNAAVRASGADGLLMVRLLRVDRQTRVTTNYAPMTFPGYYGFYTAWVAYPDVYQYDIATAEVNLFDVRTNKLVWGGTTETFNPSSVGRESAGFADVVIDALAKRGLVPGR